jgi:hypothetical protein
VIFPLTEVWQHASRASRQANSPKFPPGWVGLGATPLLAQARGKRNKCDNSISCCFKRMRAHMISWRRTPTSEAILPTLAAADGEGKLAAPRSPILPRARSQPSHSFALGNTSKLAAGAENEQRGAALFFVFGP